MNDIVIERLETKDCRHFRQINKLLAQLSESQPQLNDKMELLAILLQDNFFFLAAKDPQKPFDENIIGMAIIYFIWRPEGWLGEIHSVVVDENYRGQGIGNQLTQALLDKAAKLAKKFNKKITVMLTSSPKREAANKMYVKFGFKLVAQAVVETGGTNIYKLVITP